MANVDEIELAPTPVRDNAEQIARSARNIAIATGCRSRELHDARKTIKERPKMVEAKIENADTCLPGAERAEAADVEHASHRATAWRRLRRKERRRELESKQHIHSERLHHLARRGVSG